MQALGIAGDNVPGDAGTPFAKKGNGPGCAGLSFAKKGNGPGCARLSFVKRVMSKATQSYLLRNG